MGFSVPLGTYLDITCHHRNSIVKRRIHFFKTKFNLNRRLVMCSNHHTSSSHNFQFAIFEIKDNPEIAGSASGISSPRAVILFIVILNAFLLFYKMIQDDGRRRWTMTAFLLFYKMIQATMNDDGGQWQDTRNCWKCERYLFTASCNYFYCHSKSFSSFVQDEDELKMTMDMMTNWWQRWTRRWTMTMDGYGWT